MPATMIAAPAATDTTVVVTFALGDPLALTTVESGLADRLSHEGYLALIHETISRLEVYAHDYEEAIISERQLTFASA